ncbi:hypothetical protein GW17_00053872 [Ensete ventricosum]|nr:hypothetical protein GW17_00053872 [Ensete ventricosum]
MLLVTSPRGFLNFSATPSSIHRPCARHVLSPHHRYALGRRDGWSERWWPHARTPGARSFASREIGTVHWPTHLRQMHASGPDSYAARDCYHPCGVETWLLAALFPVRRSEERDDSTCVEDIMISFRRGFMSRVYRKKSVAVGATNVAKVLSGRNQVHGRKKQKRKRKEEEEARKMRKRKKSGRSSGVLLRLC